jgi:hypothetical protein
MNVYGSLLQFLLNFADDDVGWFRFATELAGRKARQRNWAGLAAEMVQAGWLDT